VHIKAVQIEQNSAKDEINRSKHGLSLMEARRFDWDTALEREDDRFDYGEFRFVAIGLIDARLYVMVFTEGADEDIVRVISLRPAEKQEATSYYDKI
jgi:uncharacterized protein